MIHPDLSEGAAAIRACVDAAADAGHLDHVARLALPVIGTGLYLCLLDLTLHQLDAELSQS